LHRILEGKTGLVLGVANKRSIAWACAQSLATAGCGSRLTYQGERMEAGVRELAPSSRARSSCPATSRRTLRSDDLFATLEKELGGLDAMVHAIAFAKREELAGEFVDTSRGGLGRRAGGFRILPPRVDAPCASADGGRSASIVTAELHRGERVVPNYNVMGIAKAALEASVRYLASDLGPRGIRVNAISAGPLRTLSSAGISGFSEILNHVAARAPLRRNITADEVGDTCLFLASPSLAGSRAA
jgi:enoyl-[acyl-carrier protein] reductase I